MKGGTFMIYCMSDIHGEIDRFHEMLQLIQFSEEDILYILGDVIDRKPSGVDILREIMDTPNIIMLLVWRTALRMLEGRTGKDTQVSNEPAGLFGIRGERPAVLSRTRVSVR